MMEGALIEEMRDLEDMFMLDGLMQVFGKLEVIDDWFWFQEESGNVFVQMVVGDIMYSWDDM